MIEEDLTVSESMKIDLVYQREELENFIEKMMKDNQDLRFIASQENFAHNYHNWDNIVNELIEGK